MNKGIITAVMGLGLLYTQAVSANEMIKYDHALYVADASTSETATPSKATKKTAKHHHKRHHHKNAHKHGHKHHHHKHGHKHHHHKHGHKHHHSSSVCPTGGCPDSATYSESATYGIRDTMTSQPYYNESYESSGLLGRERAARGGR